VEGVFDMEVGGQITAMHGTRTHQRCINLQKKKRKSTTDKAKM
jgi:hypothetical protein